MGNSGQTIDLSRRFRFRLTYHATATSASVCQMLGARQKYGDVGRMSLSTSDRPGYSVLEFDASLPVAMSALAAFHLPVSGWDPPTEWILEMGPVPE